MTLPQNEWRDNKITPTSVIIIQSYKKSHRHSAKLTVT